MKLTTLILNSVTTADNKALDVIRLGSVVAGAVMIGLTILTVVQGQPFDILEFGAAMAALFAGTGGGIRLKSSDEAP